MSTNKEAKTPTVRIGTARKERIFCMVSNKFTFKIPASLGRPHNITNFMDEKSRSGLSNIENETKFVKNDP